MKKWFKAMAAILIGLVLLHFGVPILLENGEAFSWARWFALVAGVGCTYAGTETVWDLADRYKRW